MVVASIRTSETETVCPPPANAPMTSPLAACEPPSASRTSIVSVHSTLASRWRPPRTASRARALPLASQARAALRAALHTSCDCESRAISSRISDRTAAPIRASRSVLRSTFHHARCHSAHGPRSCVWRLQPSPSPLIPPGSWDFVAIAAPGPNPASRSRAVRPRKSRTAEFGRMAWVHQRQQSERALRKLNRVESAVGLRIGAVGPEIPLAPESGREPP